MRNTLNIDKLARLVKAKRGSRGLRDISQEITDQFGDVSPSTLSRVENGRAPDTQTFLILCDWLQMPAGELIEVEAEGVWSSRSLATVEQIALQIRSDKALDVVTARSLVEIIRAVYREGQQRE